MKEEKEEKKESKSRKRTIKKYYTIGLKLLQENLEHATDEKALKERLIKVRPKRKRIEHWAEAVDMVIDYFHRYRRNFKGGRLVI